MNSRHKKGKSVPPQLRSGAVVANIRAVDEESVIISKNVGKSTINFLEEEEDIE
jgi:hypothetical protein